MGDKNGLWSGTWRGGASILGNFFNYSGRATTLRLRAGDRARGEKKWEDRKMRERRGETLGSVQENKRSSSSEFLELAFTERDGGEKPTIGFYHLAVRKDV